MPYMRLYTHPEYNIFNIPTEEEMNAVLINDNAGRAYRYMGTSTDDYTNGDIYIIENVDEIAYPTVTSSLTYNGSSQSPTITGYDSSKMTINGIDTAINAGEYTIGFTPTYEYCWIDGTRDTKYFTWSIDAIDITNATITLGSTLTYNGSSQTQDVSSVVISGLTATYSVSGNTGTNAGTYTLTCTGTGNFTGTATASWSIAQKSISGANINLGSTLTYNGSSQTQAISSVVIDGLTASYSVSGNSGTDAGTYTLTCTGAGNFTGTQTKSWSIARRSITGATINLGSTLTYNGSSQTQTVSSVVISGLNATYSVSGNTGTSASTYTLTCSGTGNFTGTQTKSWSIARKSISGATITLSGSHTYNGSSQTQAISSVVISGLTATYSVSGNTGTNAGSYTLTCTGTGNFTGTQTKSWSIAKATSAISLSATSGTVYTYSPLSATFTVNNTLSRSISLSRNNNNASASISGSTVTYTFAAAGTCVITVTAAASTNYNASSATFTVTCTAQYRWSKYSVTSAIKYVKKYSSPTYYYPEVRSGCFPINGYGPISFDEDTGLFSVYADRSYMPAANIDICFTMPCTYTTSDAPRRTYGTKACGYPQSIWGGDEDWTVYCGTIWYSEKTTVYSRGDTSYGYVYSTSSSAYPSNGTPDNTYWYVSG